MLYAALPSVHIDTGFLVSQLNDAPYLFLISPFGGGQNNPCAGLHSYLLLSCVLQSKSPGLLHPVPNPVATVRK